MFVLREVDPERLHDRPSLLLSLVEEGVPGRMVGAVRGTNVVNRMTNLDKT